MPRSGALITIGLTDLDFNVEPGTDVVIEDIDVFNVFVIVNAGLPTPAAPYRVSAVFNPATGQIDYTFSHSFTIPLGLFRGDVVVLRYDAAGTEAGMFTVYSKPIVVTLEQNGDVYLGPAGEEILLTPYGRRMIIKPDEISRSGRTASGRLVTDISAVKYKFEIPYSAIDGDKLLVLLSLYSLHAELTLKAYTSDSNYFRSETTGEAPIVKLSPIEREQLIMLGTGLWTGVSLTLDEI